MALLHNFDALVVVQGWAAFYCTIHWWEWYPGSRGRVGPKAHIPKFHLIMKHSC